MQPDDTYALVQFGPGRNYEVYLFHYDTGSGNAGNLVRACGPLNGQAANHLFDDTEIEPEHYEPWDEDHDHMVEYWEAAHGTLSDCRFLRWWDTELGDSGPADRSRVR